VDITSQSGEMNVDSREYAVKEHEMQSKPPTGGWRLPTKPSRRRPRTPQPRHRGPGGGVHRRRAEHRTARTPSSAQSALPRRGENLPVEPVEETPEVEERNSPEIRVTKEPLTYQDDGKSSIFAVCTRRGNGDGLPLSALSATRTRWSLRAKSGPTRTRPPVRVESSSPRCGCRNTSSCREPAVRLPTP